MAPMVLLDLWEAGGNDHRADVAAGLGWLDQHPEVAEELISDEAGLVWRKVGRREPRKAARALAAATTRVRPGWRLPGVDRLMPPGPRRPRVPPLRAGLAALRVATTPTDRRTRNDAGG